MDTLKKVFPHAYKSTDTQPFVISLILYVILGVISGFVIGLLSKIPLIGILFSIVGTVIGIYTLIGIILSILVFTKILK